MRIKRYSKLNGTEAEMKFIEDYLFANALLKYVESISEGNRWFIDECFESTDGDYWAIFKSYASPEYRNFMLSIRVSHSGSGWDFSIHKKVTMLV